MPDTPAVAGRILMRLYMAYNTNIYLMIFLPAALISYSLTKQKYRYITLALFSVLFFLSFSGKLIVWTLMTAALTWGGGLIMQRIIDENSAKPKEERLKRAELKKKTGRIAAFSVTLIVLILAGLKYTDFTLSIISDFTDNFGRGGTFSPIRILSPIGISFYSLQAVSYILDVHWKRIRAEENPLKVLLYLTFFPTLMEGPIARWDDVADTLFAGADITAANFFPGVLRIGWGLFKRMLISDRMNNMVNILFDARSHFTGLMIFITGVVVTFQLYMEFSGTIDIVIGSARLFGIRLPENFRQPFMSQNAAEFWRRWHITLGIWFKEYIFYPVSASKIMKKWEKYGRKHAGTYLTNLVVSAIALFPVWMLNGLWHGPKETYILYGVYYFIILFIGVAIEPGEKKLAEKAGVAWNSRGLTIFRRIRTFLIIITGETLFRCDTFSQFAGMMRRLFQGPWDGNILSGQLLEIGADVGDLLVIICASALVIFINLKLEKDPDLFDKIPSYSLPKRWGVYYFLIFSIIIFGAYGPGYQPVDLIYAGF